MEYLAQALFVVMSAAAIWLFARNIGKIRKVILMGRDEAIETDRSQRFNNLLLLAFGQKKMFKNPLVALMHFVIYAGFIIINIEVLEIVLDGVLGTHRLFAPVLGGFYDFLINAFEMLALGVLLVCVVFLVRRNVIKLQRFISRDLDGWPRSDANYILVTEIVLMSLFLTMNATEGVLQARGVAHYAEHPVGPFIISGALQPLFDSLSSG
ncbi:MAG TPA: hypothetical protein VLL95_08605, partial [Phnomibacter sp.]|nr:hypothetical protein [Phnomibacter sp.]